MFEPEVISAFGLGLVTDKLPNSMKAEHPVCVVIPLTVELAPVLVTEISLLVILNCELLNTLIANALPRPLTFN